MLSIESSAIESIADAIDLRQSVPMKRGSSAQCGGDLRRLILTYAASIAGRPDPKYKDVHVSCCPIYMSTHIWCGFRRFTGKPNRTH